MRVIWPMPEVFDSNGMRSFGYEDEVVLPLAITPRNPDRPMALMGELAIGVCRDTCVPVDLSVSAVLRGQGDHDPRIAQAMTAASEAGPRAGLERVTCRLEPSDRGAVLTLRATLPRQGRDEHMIVELPESPLWITNGRTWREGNDLVTEARLRDPARGPISIDRSRLALTVLGGEHMVMAQGCVSGG
ncbi:MAG: protein-disulfide reductase DsbD family protein [Paracoccaceae bacterium]